MWKSKRKWREKKSKRGRGGGLSEYRVCIWICRCVFACIFVHMPIWDRAKQRKEGEKGKARLLHAGRDDAKSAGWYKSVTTGPSRQSPLQETQIKVDLSSQDLFRVAPTSSLDPVAMLFLSVLRSVRRGDEAPEMSHGKFWWRGLRKILQHTKA